MYAHHSATRSTVSGSRQWAASSSLLLLMLVMLVGQPALHQFGRALGSVPPLPGAALDWGKLPLSFVPNAGQTDPVVRFQARGMGGTLSFTPAEVVLSLPAAAADPRPGSDDRRSLINLHASKPSFVRLRFMGANPAPAITGAERMPGIVNSFLGDDPARWQTKVPTYAGIVYGHLYPGIDLRYDGHEGLLKGTYTVAPGVDPSVIRWQYSGAQDVQVDAATGDLHISLAAADNATIKNSKLTESAPVAWQEVDGRRIAVEARYILVPQSPSPSPPAALIGFALGAYDPTRPLTIDPILEYSTYLGGRLSDVGNAIAVDGAGNVYVTGATSSTNFPTTNALQPEYGSTDCTNDEPPCSDAFVTKLNPQGNTLLYSTFLGGAGVDAGVGIAVDNAGNAYVLGTTDAGNFPTVRAFQGKSADQGCYIPDGGIEPCGDTFVTKLNAQGSALVYSTYLSGAKEDRGAGIAVDGAGNAYVTGTTFSTDFPTLRALRPQCDPGNACTDAFVTKLNAAGNALVYSTFYGGSADEYGQGIAVDRAGSAYITGETRSLDLPTANALDSSFNGLGIPADEFDGYVAKLNAEGTALSFSTYLGGSGGDYGEAIGVDGAGQAVVVGSTSSPNFPTARPFQGGLRPGDCGDANVSIPCSDAFVAKLHADGRSLVYGTYLGGNGGDAAATVAVTAAGEAYVAGRTLSGDFPTVSPFQAAYSGENCGDATFFLRCADGFVTKLQSDGQALVYSTYMGGRGDESVNGIAAGSAGNAYVTGGTTSKNFPVVRPLQSPLVSADAAFVAKISETAVAPDPAFFEVWSSTDLAVREGTTSRSWLWGPGPYATTTEPYAQSPSGKRLVEYYDKARMEINNPNGERANRFFVTNGLLPIELMTGRLKTGDAPTQAEQRQSADVPVAGDAAEANADAPTYRSFAQVATLDVAAAPRRAPSAIGSAVVATLNKAGQVGQNQGLSRYNVRVASYSQELGHNVPDVFQRYLDTLPLPAIFVMGLPISEPYWARSRVGGVERDVLMQAFERRVLTYTPANAAAFRVEMGNVGQHYYRWRYGATPWQR